MDLLSGINIYKVQNKYILNANLNQIYISIKTRKNAVYCF